MATVLDAFLVTLGLDNREFKKGSEEAEKVYGALVKKAAAAAKEIVAAAQGKTKGEIEAARASARDLVAAAKGKSQAEVASARESAKEIVAAAKGKSQEEVEAAKMAAREIVSAAQGRGKAEIAAATAAAGQLVATAQEKAKGELAIANTAAKDRQAVEVKAAKAIKDNLVKETQEANEKIKKQTEKGKEFFKEVGVAAMEFFGIMAAAAGMVEFVKSTLEAEVGAGRLAKTLNVDVEELEALQGAVKRVGGTSEGLDASLKGLNSRLEMIAIHGPRSKMALTVFAGLGISAVSLKGKDAIGVLGLLSEKMAGMSEAKAQGLGERLGLDEGTIRLLTKGKEGMAALVEHQKKLGVASKEQGEEAEKLEQSMLDFKDSASAVGRELLSALLPALSGLGKVLAAVSSWMSEHSEIVKAGILGIAAAFLVVNANAILMGINAAIAWFMATWPLALLVAGIALVAGGLYLLVTHFKEVGHWANETALNIVFHLLKAFFTVEHAAAKMWRGLKESAMAPLEWIWSKLKAIIDIAKQEGNFFSAIIHGDVKGAVGAVKAAVSDVGSVAGLTPATAGGPSLGPGAAQARPVTAGMALRPSSVSNNHTTHSTSRQTTVNIGTVTTQAKDAQGLANELPGAVQSHSSLVDQADGGF